MRPVSGKRLGAGSVQSSALAALAIPGLGRAGFRPSARMERSARWGVERGVDARWDFRLRGIR